MEQANGRGPERWDIFGDLLTLRFYFSTRKNRAELVPSNVLVTRKYPLGPKTLVELTVQDGAEPSAVCEDIR